MKKIKDLGDLNQKIVLLRVDLNVPLQNNKVLDATRIKKVIPTISHLLSENAKIIIIGNNQYFFRSFRKNVNSFKKSNIKIAFSLIQAPYLS